MFIAIPRVSIPRVIPSISTIVIPLILIASIVIPQIIIAIIIAVVILTDRGAAVASRAVVLVTIAPKLFRRLCAFLDALKAALISYFTFSFL